jgi:hypothetical protein
VAQVDETLRQDIERLLDRLTYEWGRLPEVEAEIDQWDQIDQIVFIEEWPLEEDWLARLERYVAGGAVTAKQLAEYEKLKAIVAQNRPIIERLRRG